MNFETATLELATHCLLCNAFDPTVDLKCALLQDLFNCVVNLTRHHTLYVGDPVSCLEAPVGLVEHILPFSRGYRYEEARLHNRAGTKHSPLQTHHKEASPTQHQKITWHWHREHPTDSARQLLARKQTTTPSHNEDAWIQAGQQLGEIHCDNPSPVRQHANKSTMKRSLCKQTRVLSFQKSKSELVQSQAEPTGLPLQWNWNKNSRKRN